MNLQQTQEALTLAQRLTAILAEREPETEWPAIAGLATRDDFANVLGDFLADEIADQL